MKKRFWLQILAVFMTAVLALPVGAVFSDDGQIGTQYAEAVLRMAERGVLNGFPDGSFLPADTLTREQGAKIAAYIVLGDKVEMLICYIAPFDDVSANRWSAPCIAWCAQRQILLGYGDGRFGPADTLTGDQFAKMLLCALGLAREGNYVGLGDAWTAAVREDGNACALYEGNSGMVTSQPISRQQAALLAFNAIRAVEAAQGGSGGGTTDPAAPDNPTNPTNPDTPANPTNPEDPNLPDDPTDPDYPTDPQQPDDPTDPGSGSGTGQQPDDPQDPGQGSDPGEGGGTETPDLPEPSDPADPTDPDEPADPTDPDPGSGGGSGNSGGDSGDILLPEVP